MLKPEGIPVYQHPIGMSEQILTAGEWMKDAGPRLADTGRAVHREFQGLAGIYQAPEAVQLLGSTQRVVDLTGRTKDRLVKVGQALTEYYHEMRPCIQRLQDLQNEARWFVANAKPGWQGFKNWVEHHERIRKDIGDTVTAWYDAQIRCANKIAGAIDVRGYDPKNGVRVGDAVPNQEGGDKEPPWGGAEEWDAPWGLDVVFFVGNFGKAILWDLPMGVLDVTTKLTGIQWALHEIPGVNDFFTKVLHHPLADMHATGDAWATTGKELGKLAILAAVPPFIWPALPAIQAANPELAKQLGVTFVLDLAKEFGKNFVAWDEWKDNPGKALGNVVINIASLAIPGVGSVAAKTVTTLARVGTTGAKIARGLEGVSNLANKLSPSRLAMEQLAKIPKVGEVMGKVGLVDLPKLDVPKIDVPKVNVPKTDIPKVDIPHQSIEVPHTPGSVDPTHQPITTPTPTHVDPVTVPNHPTTPPTHVDPTPNPVIPGTPPIHTPGTTTPGTPSTHTPGTTTPGTTTPGTTTPGTTTPGTTTPGTTHPGTTTPGTTTPGTTHPGTTTPGTTTPGTTTPGTTQPGATHPGSTNQPGTPNQPSTTHPGSTNQPGTPNQPGTTHPGNTNEPGTTNQPGTPTRSSEPTRSSNEPSHSSTEQSRPYNYRPESTPGHHETQSTHSTEPTRTGEHTTEPTRTGEPTRTNEHPTQPTRTGEHTAEPTRSGEPTRTGEHTAEPTRSGEPTRTGEPTRSGEPARTGEPTQPTRTGDHTSEQPPYVPVHQTTPHTTPSTTPQHARPEPTRPESTRPDGTRPDGTRSDGTRPDGTRPDGTRPDGTRPDGTRPDGSRPDGTRPDGTRHDGTRQDGTRSDGDRHDGDRTHGTTDPAVHSQRAAERAAAQRAGESGPPKGDQFDPNTLYKEKVTGGGINQPRSEVQPWRYTRHDPDGTLQRDFTARVGNGRPVDTIDQWIQHGNPHYKTGRDEFTNNCPETSRNFADTLQGVRTEIAHGDLRIPPGEMEEMYEWAGTKPRKLTTPQGMSNRQFTENMYEAVRKELHERPPGTVAIVGGGWEGGGGHWFNAYKHEHKGVQHADLQDGRTGNWGGNYKRDFDRFEVMVREPGGKWTSPDITRHLPPPGRIPNPGTPNPPAKHPHTDGVVPGPGEIDRRLDPAGHAEAEAHRTATREAQREGVTPTPAEFEHRMNPEGRPASSEQPSRISERLEPEGAGRTTNEQTPYGSGLDNRLNPEGSPQHERAQHQPTPESPAAHEAHSSELRNRLNPEGSPQHTQRHPVSEPEPTQLNDRLSPEGSPQRAEHEAVPEHEARATREAEAAERQSRLDPEGSPQHTQRQPVSEAEARAAREAEAARLNERLSPEGSPQREPGRQDVADQAGAWRSEYEQRMHPDAPGQSYGSTGGLGDRLNPQGSPQHERRAEPEVENAGLNERLSPEGSPQNAHNQPVPEVDPARLNDRLSPEGSPQRAERESVPEHEARATREAEAAERQGRLSPEGSPQHTQRQPVSEAEARAAREAGAARLNERLSPEGSPQREVRREVDSQGEAWRAEYEQRMHPGGDGEAPYGSASRTPGDGGESQYDGVTPRDGEFGRRMQPDAGERARREAAAEAKGAEIRDRLDGQEQQWPAPDVHARRDTPDQHHTPEQHHTQEYQQAPDQQRMQGQHGTHEQQHVPEHQHAREQERGWVQERPGWDGRYVRDSEWRGRHSDVRREPVQVEFGPDSPYQFGPRGAHPEARPRYDEQRLSQQEEIAGLQTTYQAPGLPGQHRSELDSHRYQAMDPDGRTLRELTELVGPDPLATLGDWVQLLNRHHDVGVEFQFNCSSGVRAFADTVQGLPPRLAEGDFNRGVVWDDQHGWIPGKTPGDYDHSFEWMGVSGPYRMHTWTHPQHDRMGEINQSLGQFTRDAYDSVAQDLLDRPPGTVALVCVRWRSGAGHWFAGVVGHDGRIIHVDVQPRPPIVHAWPPPYPTEITRLEHVIREPGGAWQGALPWEPNSTWDSHAPVGQPTEDGR